MIKVLKAFAALVILPLKVRTFYPAITFKDKKVAIIGAADSAFEHEGGKIIDGFDLVVRINKALVTWNSDNEKFLGKKTDILLHNFHENMDTGGGGPLDIELYNRFGLRYLVQPRFDWDGWRSMFNYFKKYLNVRQTVYIFSYSYYKRITDMFAAYHPTKGFCALYAAMTSPCREILITGFTFFKTPYAPGYRDNIRDTQSNREHILRQGLHDIDMEFNNFLVLLQATTVKSILVDMRLYEIISVERPDLTRKIKVIQ